MDIAVVRPGDAQYPYLRQYIDDFGRRPPYDFGPAVHRYNDLVVGQTMTLRINRTVNWLSAFRHRGLTKRDVEISQQSLGGGVYEYTVQRNTERRLQVLEGDYASTN